MKKQPTLSLKALTDDWVQWWFSENPLLFGKLIQHASLQNKQLAKQGVMESCRFLYLCSISNQTLTPSKKVDDIWHQMILFTRSYDTFCITQLGRFIHHQPSDKPVCELRQYLATLSLYEQTFGVLDPTFWSQPNSESGESKTDCGACES